MRQLYAASHILTPSQALPQSRGHEADAAVHSYQVFLFLFFLNFNNKTHIYQ